MKRERCILGPSPSEGVVGARLHRPGSRAFPRPGFHPGPSWHLSCPRGSLSHNSGGRHSLKGLRLEPAALTLTLCHWSSRWIRTAPPLPGGHRDPGTRRGGYRDEPPPFPLLGSQFGFTVGVSCPRGALSRRGRAAMATEQQCAVRDGAGCGGPCRSSSARGVGGGGSERGGGQGVPTEPLGEDAVPTSLARGAGEEGGASQGAAPPVSGWLFSLSGGAPHPLRPPPQPWGF